MKKIVRLLAILAFVTAVTGCLDDPDGSGGRPKSSVAVEMQ
jgi:hypothetical protein